MDTAKTQHNVPSPSDGPAFDFLDAAWATDTGQVRKHNEDSGLCLKEQGIFAVADGMGGTSFGEVASRCVIQALEQYRADTGSPDEAIAAVKDSITRASQHVHQMAQQKNFSSMGSTVVLLIFHAARPGHVTLLHAGDSRAYRLRKRKFTQLMEDHSYEAAYAKIKGKVPPFLKSVVTRAVGIEETLELEKTSDRAKPGDLYLLCSDGLYNMVPDKKMRSLLLKNKTLSLQQQADMLVAEANAGGGKDNITVVLVRVGKWDPSNMPQASDTVRSSHY